MDMKDRILGRIRRGEVAMHSQSFFTLKLVALLLASFLALVVSVLLFTFIFFTVRVNIHSSFAVLGPRTLFFLFHFFPWHLVMLDVALIALTEWLLRDFKFAYRSPFLYLLFAVFAFVLALGLFIDRVTPFSDRMLEHAHAHHLPPPINDMYEYAEHREIWEIEE